MTNLNRPFAIIFVLCSTYHTAFTQERGVAITLGKSSDNSYTRGKEAEVIGTFPDSTNAKDAWLTNAFLEISFTNTKRWNFGLIGEMHRNSLISKEQHVIQYGGSVAKAFVIIRDITTGAAKFEMPTTLTIKQSNDRQKDVETLQVIASTSLNRFNGKSFLNSRTGIPALTSEVAHIFQFSQAHAIGLAYLGEDEDVLLGTLDFELNAFLFPRLVDKLTAGKYVDLLRVQLSYRGRSPLAGTTDLHLNSTIDLQCGLNIRLGEGATNTIGIAYDWIQGANPMEGLANQKYETFTAKVKFVIKK